MFETGLLILTRPIPVLRQQIPAIVSEVTKTVSNTLYVHIQPWNHSTSNFNLTATPCNTDFDRLMTELYASSASLCNNLDVYVLLGNVTRRQEAIDKNLCYKFCKNYQVVLFDNKNIVSQSNDSILRQYLSTCFKTAFNEKMKIEHLEALGSDDQSTIQDLTQENSLRTYQNVVLGGTFDRLHAGHKILLGKACLHTDQQLTVGVTDENMNKKKTLCEMIEPLDNRITSVCSFIEDVKPTIKHRVVPISDMFGPTITDPELQCIVVSEETKKGGQVVNQEREKKNFQRLDEVVIDLVEDKCHSQYEETKISSSSLRKRLLGTVFNAVKPNNSIPDSPYIIGLTGGIASGKSAICKRLEGLGAVSIDCDKLGHQVYIKGTDAYNKLVEVFGKAILQDNGEINRRALGGIVFSDPAQMKMLNSIVWPEIAKLAKEKIQDLGKAGKSTVVLEAAVLLEAGWDTIVHEIWTSIVPPQEAVKRMMVRNKMTEEEALKRLNSQISNSERVSRSNVVFSSLWEYEYTQQQVEKAWQLLMQRIPSGIKTKSQY